MVADLDEDEFTALDAAVRDKLQDESWTSTHELLATIVEAQWRILARLSAGIPVGMAASIGEPETPDRYPRPEWVQAIINDQQRQQAGADDVDNDGTLVFHHVRDALHLIKGGKRG